MMMKKKADHLERRRKQNRKIWISPPSHNSKLKVKIYNNVYILFKKTYD